MPASKLLHSSSLTQEKAHDLRRQATYPERLLWKKLRAHRQYGLKFRRQQPVGPFVADFLCVSARLIVELDGHSHEDRMEYDARRTAYLQEQGFRVIRFSDDCVLRNTGWVLDRIIEAAGVQIE